MSGLRKNWLEWVVFSVSLVLVAGTIGFLAYDAVRGGLTPPDVVVEPGRPERRGALWAVPVRVRNAGDETAEGVRVEVTLETPGEEPEVADFEVAFVPRRSSREGWVLFARDPAGGRLTGRAVGYEKP
ncbi:MAG TPA: hypothetical protein VMW27_25835 [Thermoanaerobaculia bacterium]|nr:hypothetical protein [Thermoanaerobaculia bacterium]